MQLLINSDRLLEIFGYPHRKASSRIRSAESVLVRVLGFIWGSSTNGILILGPENLFEFRSLLHVNFKLQRCLAALGFYCTKLKVLTQALHCILLVWCQWHHGFLLCLSRTDLFTMYSIVQAIPPFHFSTWLGAISQTSTFFARHDG
jgi:hypothetical protein